MKIKNLLPVMVIAPLILSGCASSRITPQIKEVKSEVNALEELRDISIEARHELRILAKLQESKHMKTLSDEQHQQRFLQATAVPKDFERLVSFTYTGPAIKVADAIAKIAGYKLVIDGKKPAMEPWVRVNIVNEPLNEALKELGAQTGEAVVVGLHESAKVLRFVYQ